MPCTLPRCGGVNRKLSHCSWDNINSIFHLRRQLLISDHLGEHSPRSSFTRTSMTLPRRSLSRSRKSIGNGRPSMASSRLQPIRDELDSWLKGREQDVEMAPEDLSAYQSPRQSMGRLSFASSECRPSTQDEYFDELIDEGLVLDDSAVFERCFQHIDDF